LDYSGLFRTVRDYSGILTGLFRIEQDIIHDYSGLIMIIQTYSGVFATIQDYSGGSRDANNRVKLV